MNGNWYSWSIGSTPNDYVLAWRHTYNILLNTGIDSTRLQWVWSVNRNDYGQYTAEEYWVGENYTHWLGINGFNGGSSANWSKWEWPNEIFDNMMGRLHKLSSTKPISLNAYATVGVRTGNTTDVQSKNEWLRQMCDYVNRNKIKMASYNNVDGPNQDNMVFGGTHGDVIWNNFKAYSAYRNCLQSNDWIEPNITNPRLITDEVFAGSPLDCSIYNSNKEIIQSLPFRVDINPRVNSPGSSYARVDYGGRVTDFTLTIVNTIPTSIFCLDSLKSLTIEYGTSLTIPPEIARLRSYLTSLGLIEISSRLTLPSELFNLTNLVSLSIISCGLETLPDATSQLSALSELDLTGNRLTSIPVTLAQIFLLRTLVLNANPGLLSLDNLQGTQFC
ncbi:unnamed protein product [Rotaria magnacalcarata]|uniref:GH26 domain-containing protein n=4 Tax=Rotaria magnacalcarata TaxID=392030 RepID=A0A816EIA4_9BILA|nr:unnamed protein product [Rotaria magnacalcarata]CAF1646351.1 unnamed protein product [Rotaria magnacalcarata]CAF2132105.1 unnamed protein product [Rotaria magnacalcarata]